MERCLKCAKCQGNLCREEYLCKFESTSGTHWCFKPERVEELITGERRAINIVPVKRSKDLQCAHCNASIGKYITHGKEPFFAVEQPPQTHANSNASNKKKKGPPKVAYEVGIGERLEKRTESNFDPRKAQDDRVVRDKIATVFPDSNIEDVTKHCREVAPVEYQIELFYRGLAQNSLIVLPTGCGKTLISSMIASKMSTANPKKLCAFLALTIPLVCQQHSKFKFQSPLNNLNYLFGERRTDKKIRGLLAGKWQVVVFTAGLFGELLRTKTIAIHDFHTIIFDEAHNAQHKSKHEYVQIMEFYANSYPQECRPRIIALSASPASGKSKESCKNNIKEIAALFHSSLLFPTCQASLKSLQEYKQKTPVTILSSKFSTEQKEFNNHLLRFLTSKLRVNHITIWSSSLTLSLRSLIGNLKGIEGGTQFWFDFISIFEICELFGVHIAQQELKGFYNISVDNLGSQLKIHFQSYQNCVSKEQPRINQIQTCLRGVLSNQGIEDKSSLENFRGLIFVHTRKTARMLLEHLNSIPDIAQLNPKIFVGHNEFDGMGSNEQKRVMEEFNEGRTKLLVGTSVLEEGIDVPGCNFVMMFQEVRTFRSFIQIRGRARATDGHCIVITDNEESVKQKEIEEKIMLDALKDLQETKPPIGQDFINMALDSESYRNRVKGLGDESLDRSPFICIIFSNPKDMTCIKQADLKYKKIGARLVRIDPFPMAKEDFVSKFCSCEDLWSNNTMLFQVVGVTFEQKRELSGRLCVGSIIHNKTFLESKSNAFDSHLANSPWIISKNESQLVFRSIKTQISFPVSALNFCVFDATNQEGIVIYFHTQIAPFVSEGSRSVWKHGPFEQHHLVQFFIPTEEGLFQNVFSFLDSLHSTFGIQFYFSRYELSSVSYEAFSLLSHSSLKQWTFEERYAFESVIHQFGKDFENYYLNSESRDKLFHFLDMVQDKELFFRDVKKKKLPQGQLFHDFSFESISIIEPNESPPFEIPVDGYKYIRALRVTPSRLILVEPYPLQLNSITRLLNPSDVLMLRFTEENESKKYPIELLDFILAQFNDSSPLTIGGRVFKLLGFSGSQIRSRACFFYSQDKKDASSYSIEEIYSYIGDLSQIQSQIKQYSRMTLAFSSTMDTGLDIKPEIIDDIVRNGFEFTDGCGRASNEVMEKLANACGEQLIPSCFQVRIGGIKGVILIEKSLCGLQIQCPKSMQKFQSRRERVEVVSFSGYSPGFLNHQLITILSDRGIPDESFISLQHKQFRLLLEGPTGTSNFPLWNSMLPPIRETLSKVTKSQPKINIFNEPFFQSIKNTSLQFHLENTNVRLFVPDSRMAIIVPDYSGKLKENEIYFQCSSPTYSGYQEIIGDVILCKFPAHAPGDILKVSGVHIPEWNSLYVDIIIVSTLGNRPMADKSSGGDYDGDRFWICWDSSLIPETDYEPQDYSLVQNGDPCERKLSLFEYYCQFAFSQSLGVFSNYHLALSNLICGGTTNPICIELSQQLSVAVDSAKTGLIQNVSPAVKEFLKGGYPPFMKKKNTQKCYSICQKLADERAILWETMKVDSLNQVATPNFYQQFNHDLIELVTCAYNRYHESMTAVLHIHGIASEAEIFSGYIQNVHHSFDIFKVLKTAQQQVTTLWKDLSSTFRKDISTTLDEQEAVEFATCWFQYGKNQTFQSFSWTASEFLTPNPNLSSHCLVNTVVEYWNFTKLEKRNSFLSSIRICTALEAKLNANKTSSGNGFKLHLFGSRSILLHDEESDIDLYCTFDGKPLGNHEKDHVKNILMIQFRCIIEPVILKGELWGYRVPYYESEGEPPTHIDVMMKTEGVEKRNFLFSHIVSRPTVLVFLSIIMAWGRNWDVRAIIGNPSSFGIAVWATQFAIEQGFIGSGECYQYSLDDSIVDRATEDLRKDCGDVARLLISFFETYSQIVPKKTADPITKGDYCINVADSDQQVLKNCCLSAYGLLTGFNSITTFLERLPSRKDKFTQIYPIYRKVDVEILQRIDNEAIITSEWDANSRKSRITIIGDRRSHTLIKRELQRITQIYPVFLCGTSIFDSTASSWFFDFADPHNDGDEIIQFGRNENSKMIHRRHCSVNTWSATLKSNMRQVPHPSLRNCFLQKFIQQMKKVYRYSAFQRSEIEYKIRFGGVYFLNVDSLPSGKQITISKQEADAALQMGYTQRDATRIKPKKVHLACSASRPTSPSPKKARNPNSRKKERKVTLRSSHGAYISVGKWQQLKSFFEEKTSATRSVQLHVYFSVGNQHNRAREITAIYEKNILSETPGCYSFTADDLKRFSGEKVMWLSFGISSADYLGYRVTVASHIPMDKHFLLNKFTISIKDGIYVGECIPNGLKILNIRFREKWSYLIRPYIKATVSTEINPCSRGEKVETVQHWVSTLSLIKKNPSNVVGTPQSPIELPSMDEVKEFWNLASDASRACTHP